MRAIAAVVAAALLAFAGAIAAQPTSQPASTQPAETAQGRPAPQKQLRVLCTTFPVYLFTRNVAVGARNVQVDILISPALGCPHDYALTPQDMRNIASADVLVINGQGMEPFTDTVTKANPNITVIDSSQGVKDIITLKGEEVDQVRKTDRLDRHHMTTVNPHLFASPKTAAQVVRRIATGLSAADPANEKLYARNAEAYAARLEKLAAEFVDGLNTVKSRKIVTQHAVFDYLARDCGLEVVAIVEESPGQEPAAAQMIQIVKQIKSSGATAVFTEPQYPAKAARTIAREARVQVAALDPVASGPNEPSPEYYENIMRHNLTTLQKVLGQKDK